MGATITYAARLSKPGRDGQQRTEHVITVRQGCRIDRHTFATEDEALGFAASRPTILSHQPRS